MILLDANILIYAVNTDAPQHQQARSWLESTFSSTTEVGLPWIVVLAFIRITTRRTVFEHPLTPEQALAYMDEWLALPFVTTVAPGPNHWPILRNLLERTGLAGNLSSDAHIAALAIDHGCPVYSTDYDFLRFPGIEHVNPLV